MFTWLFRNMYKEKSHRIQEKRLLFYGEIDEEMLTH